MANIIPYREFLKRKELREQETGITVSSQQLHPSLFDWQKRIVTWACKVGRAAIWADTGLGKTRMQLEWLRQVCAGHGTGLILAPLAVCQQTIREGAAIGMEVRYVHDQSEVSDGFSITNYERVPKLDVSKFNAVVLDEASILKQSDGKTRKNADRHVQGYEIPSRLYRHTGTERPGGTMQSGRVPWIRHPCEDACHVFRA